MSLEKFAGTQPVRVLQNFITAKFENTNASFFESTQKAINDLGLDPGIAFHLNKFPIIQKVDGHIQTPYVKNNKIHLHETFLSYVWCICYSLISMYDLVDDFNKGSTSKDTKITEAINVFNYGVYLIKDFIEWDKEELPNPELYPPENKVTIDRTNIIFLYAINFILCHEFAHIEYKHTHSEPEIEKEADRRAIELMLQGRNSKTKGELNGGMLAGLCCLLFFSESTISHGKSHPDVDDRINDLLELLDPDPTDFIWGLAYLAYRFWDYKFSKSYPWPDHYNSPKELYKHFYMLLQEEKLKFD